MAQSPLTLVEENGRWCRWDFEWQVFTSVLLGVFLNWSVGHHEIRNMSKVKNQCRAMLGACRTLPDLSLS